MPVSNDPAALKSAVLAALQSKSYDPSTRTQAAGLSGNEVDKLLKELKKDGVTDDEVKAVVDALVDAIKGGFDASGAREQKNIARLLDKVDKLRPGVIADKAQFTSGTTTSWMALLQARAGGSPAPTPPAPTPPAPTPPSGAVPLPQPAFDGQALAVDPAGTVALGGAVLTLEVKGNTNGPALLSLLRPGALAALDAPMKEKLADAVVAHLAAGLPLDPTSTTKFHPAVAAFAACGVVAELGASLSPSAADTLAGLIGKLPSLAAEALVRRALAAGPQTQAVEAARKGFAAADAAAATSGEHDKILAAYDAFRSERGRVGGADVQGAAVIAALSCLAFAKGQTAVDNIGKGLEIWSKMDGQWGSPLSADEAGKALRMLEPYINNASTTNLVFGAFVADAPKEIAKAQCAETSAKIEPLLSASKPTFAGVPLSTEQAAFLKMLLPAIKDDATVAALGRALATAHGVFTTHLSSWGTPPPPKEPLSPAAFGIFSRVAQAAFEARSGSADGMIDVRAFERAIADEASAIGDTVKPFLVGLAQGVIRDGTTSVTVSPQMAAELKALVTERTRSTLSVGNLGSAAILAAQRNGGKLEGAAAAAFSKILGDYLAEFPDVKLLDFNKLGRITSFALDGKTVPLCTLNGQPVKLADFYGQVAGAVAKSIQTDLRYPWVSQRWGMRARQSVELLDVIAQKTAEKTGPITLLMQQFPGSAVKVIATGKDGEHERFLFQVGNRFFAEASDGRVQPYDVAKHSTEPTLFTATVRDDGAFDVQVPATNRVRKYPTQGTYAVGDSIDLAFRDHAAANSYDEGKPFSTQFKVTHGKIVGFDAGGNYTVEYVDPQGRVQQKTLTIDEIKKYNHPHNFAEHSSYFSDVVINIQTDKVLREFLEGADPIIQRHLPSDGSLLGLSAQDLARRQKKCVEDLMAYAKKHMRYPQEKEHATDEASKEYHRLISDSGWSRVDLGELVRIQRGVCRHQCIVQQLLLQRAGIDARLASGAANTSSGDFRGFHIWIELTLADNARYLSDQTWDDPYIPLWEGAYSVDKQRAEMYDRTSSYDINLVR